MSAQPIDESSTSVPDEHVPGAEVETGETERVLSPVHEPLELRGTLEWAAHDGLWRWLSALTLLTTVRSLIAWFSRWILCFDRVATVERRGDELVVSEVWKLFGTPVRRAVHRYPLRAIQTLTWLTDQKERRFAVGLGSLFVGTALGAWLFARGLRAPGVAWSLLVVGAIVAAVGVGLDYWLQRSDPVVSGRIRVRPIKGRGWVLKADRAEAQAWFSALEL